MSTYVEGVTAHHVNGKRDSAFLVDTMSGLALPVTDDLVVVPLPDGLFVYRKLITQEEKPRQVLVKELKRQSYIPIVNGDSGLFDPDAQLMTTLTTFVQMRSFAAKSIFEAVGLRQPAKASNNPVRNHPDNEKGPIASGNFFALMCYPWLMVACASLTQECEETAHTLVEAVKRIHHLHGERHAGGTYKPQEHVEDVRKVVAACDIKGGLSAMLVQDLIVMATTPAGYEESSSAPRYTSYTEMNHFIWALSSLRTRVKDRFQDVTFKINALVI